MCTHKSLSTILCWVTLLLRGPQNLLFALRKINKSCLQRRALLAVESTYSLGGTYGAFYSWENTEVWASTQFTSCWRQDLSRSPGLHASLSFRAWRALACPSLKCPVATDESQVCRELSRALKTKKSTGQSWLSKGKARPAMAKSWTPRKNEVDSFLLPFPHGFTLNSFQLFLMDISQNMDTAMYPPGLGVIP